MSVPQPPPPDPNYGKNQKSDNKPDDLRKLLSQNPHLGNITITELLKQAEEEDDGS